MTCTVSDFNNILVDLQNEWPSVWASQQWPRRAGLSFGSCWGICGSLGLTNVVGPESLVPNIAGATVAFSDCTASAVATLTVPINAVTSTFSVQGRATGLNTLWPSTGEAFQMTGPVSGLVLLTVPLAGQTANYVDLSIDVVFYANITSAWPNTGSVIFNAVPTGSLAQTWASDLNNTVKASVSGELRKRLQAPGSLLACTIPASVDQTCTSSTSMPGSACAPCDTCCKCLVQQRCDGSCSSCACVGCHEWRTALISSPTWALFMLFTLLFVATWISRAKT